MTPRIVVVGLGPAGPELVTDGTKAAIESVQRRFVRTFRHPSVGVVPQAISFDDVYEAAATIAEVYAIIVDRLVQEAVAHGEVLYAVPGSPRVAEATVDMLGSDERIDAVVHPAMSFLDLTWVRLGLDPLSGVSVLDGHDFARQAAGSVGPFLVAQCDSPHVLSELKISIDAPEKFEVQVLQRLGLPDESVQTVRLADLDRTVSPDHLTSVFVPTVATPVAPEFARLDQLVVTLRRECPWDREQTHASLRPHLLEEAYEVLEAIDGVSAEASADSYAHLEEELGDLLYQVYFHATLAAEEGEFGVGDVARGIHDKLRRRHPHVFGDEEVTGSGEVLSNWETIKRAEKQRDSALDGIPTALPALQFAAKIQAKSGVAPSSELVEAARRVLAATDEEAEAAIAELLLATVAVSRDRGVDPESALRSAAGELAARFRAAESIAAGEGVELATAEDSVRDRFL